jgi:hypothetical protein
MTDYSEIFIEINKTLKSYYNNQIKENYEHSAKAANDIAKLADKLKELAKAKA